MTSLPGSPRTRAEVVGDEALRESSCQSSTRREEEGDLSATNCLLRNSFRNAINVPDPELKSPFAYATVLSSVADVIEMECLLNCLFRTRPKYPLLLLCPPEMRETAENLVARLSLLEPRPDGTSQIRVSLLDSPKSLPPKHFPNFNTTRSQPDLRGSALGRGLSPLRRGNDKLPSEAFEGRRGGKQRVVVIPVSGQPELCRSAFCDGENLTFWRPLWRLQLKVEAWRLMDFEKVLLLDPNCLVLRSVDFLFERKVTEWRPAMAPSFTPPDRFDCAVILLQPSLAVHALLWTHVKRLLCLWSDSSGCPSEDGTHEEAPSVSPDKRVVSSCSSSERPGKCLEAAISSGFASPSELADFAMNSFFDLWFQWASEHRLSFSCNANPCLLRKEPQGLDGNGAGEGRVSSASSQLSAIDFKKAESKLIPRFLSSSEGPASQALSLNANFQKDKSDNRSLRGTWHSKTVINDDLSRGGVGSASLGLSFVVSAMKSLLAELAGHRSSSCGSSDFGELDSEESLSSVANEQPSSECASWQSSLSSDQQRRRREGLSSLESFSSSDGREDSAQTEPPDGAVSEDCEGFTLASQETLARELSAHVRGLLQQSTFSASGKLFPSPSLPSLSPAKTSQSAKTVLSPKSRVEGQSHFAARKMGERLLTRRDAREGKGEAEDIFLKRKAVGSKGSADFPLWWMASRPFFILKFSDANERVAKRQVNCALDVLWWRGFFGLDPLGDEELAECL